MSNFLGIHFHKWEQWTQYKQKFLISTGMFEPKEIKSKTFEEWEDWQKRKCKECGYEQREEANGR